MPTIALRLLLLALAATLVPPVYADPPAHAPAHGWRKKHDPDYAGYSGRTWSRDYGIVEGRCDARSLGESLGRSVGGAVGGQVGSGEGRNVAILIGEIIGESLGRRVLKDTPDVAGTDRACLAHALELARDGQRVAWTNPVNGTRYLLTPGRLDKRCRDFTLQIGRDRVQRRACLNPTGSWEMRY